MIVATVITCPQRWPHYRRFYREFGLLRFPCPLRTFQTAEGLDSPRLNTSLNARAALSYALERLPEQPSSWVLFLEDDVRLAPRLPELLSLLVEEGVRRKVDCWYLCNRKNPIQRQFTLGAVVVNELGSPIQGTHALLLPRRNLKVLLDWHWRGLADEAVFTALARGGRSRVWQIVEPVLVEHTGHYSTYNANEPRHLEVNYANRSDLGSAATEQGDHPVFGCGRSDQQQVQAVCGQRDGRAVSGREPARAST